MNRFVFLLSLFVLAFLSCKNPKSSHPTTDNQQDTVQNQQPVQQTTSQPETQPLSFTRYADMRSFVRIVKFSPDGQYIASGNVQLAIFKRTSKGFDLVKLFAPHSDRINAIDFSPDGRYMATASDDSTVIIYDFQGAQTKVFKQLTDFSADLVTITFSPDGKFLACATNNDSVFVYDVTNNFSPLTKFEVIGVVDVKFTHDGKYLLADAELEYDAGYENQLNVYDVQNSFNLVSSVNLEPMGYKITVSPDDKTVFASGSEVSYLLNLSNGRLSIKQKLHINGDIPGAFADNNLLIAGNQVRRDNVSMKILFVSQLTDDQSINLDLDLSQDKKFLAISYNDGKILIYQLNGQSLVKFAVLQDFPVFVRSLTFTADSYTDYLVTGSGDGSSWADIRLLNMKNPLGTGNRIAPDTLYNEIVSLSASPLGNFIAAGDWRGNLYVFNWVDSANYTLSQKFHVGDQSVLVGLSRDENYLVAACGSTLQLLRRNNSEFHVVRTLNEPAEIQALALSADGEFVAVFESPQLVKIFSVLDSFNTFRSFTVKPTAPAPPDVTKSLSFSPDNKELAVLMGYPARKVFIFSFEGQFVTVINVNGDLKKAAYSSDGKYLAISVGSLIQIYKNTATGYEFFKEISAGPNTIQDIAFSSKGNYFAYATDDGVVVFK